MIVVILLLPAHQNFQQILLFFSPGEMFDSWTHAQSNLLFIAPDQRDFSYSPHAAPGISLDGFIVAIFAHKKRSSLTFQYCTANTVQLSVIFDSPPELKSNSHIHGMLIYGI
jgi:hypothetical protein